MDNKQPKPLIRKKFRYGYLFFMIGFVLLAWNIYEVTELNFEEEIVLCEDNIGNKITGSECIKEDSFSDALVLILFGLFSFALLSGIGYWIVKIEKDFERMNIQRKQIEKKMKEHLANKGLLDKDDYDYFEIK